MNELSKINIRQNFPVFNCNQLQLIYIRKKGTNFYSKFCFTLYFKFNDKRMIHG